MVLQIFALAFVIGIVLLQSLYGLFSGLIMVVCSIIAAVVAIGSFEAITESLTTQFVSHPSYAASGTLVVVFILTLLILRLAADNLIRGNVRLPKYVDVSGGAACGFISAQLCVGVLMMGVFMLPLGNQVLLYKRYVTVIPASDSEKAEIRRAKLWTNPDGFTASLVSALSGGSLAGQTALSSVYPDFVEWIAWTGNTVQKESYSAPTRDKADGYESLTVVESWEQKQPLGDARYRTQAPARRGKKARYRMESYSPDAGMRLLGVRLRLTPLAADRHPTNNRTAGHRFRPTMFRVVGTGRGGRPKHFPARLIGNADPKIDNNLRLVDLDSNFFVEAEGDIELDVYFEVGEEFVSAFVEYRRFARAALRIGEEEGPEGEIAANVSTSGDGDSGGRTVGGVRSFIEAVHIADSGDKPRLPFALARNRVAGGDVDLEGGKFASGRVFGDRETLRAAVRVGSVTEFKIPSGYRLCRILFEPKTANSIPGRAYNYAVRNLNQYFAVDTQGVKYWLTGYYGIITRNGRERIEIFYTGEAKPMTFRGMLDFKDIKNNELIADNRARIGLLFLVPPGRTIVEIHNQAGPQYRGLEFTMNDG